MKSILYAAAVLMIGASIYGFIDYSKASHHKEFQNLYKDEDETKTVIPDTIIAKKEVSGAVKKEDTVKTETTVRKTIVKKTISRKKAGRKFSLKSFSRAPLRDKFVPPAVETVEEKGQEKSIQ